jgi:flagellar hook-associated protein 1 FlgK
MSSTFGGISTALSSLYANRRGLDVTGQNIANANTEGYSRQRVNMQAQSGTIMPAMWSTTDGLGTGVAVSDVQRLRSDFQENRGRTEHGQNAYLTDQTQAYASIEDVFAEPGDTALQAQMQDMWASWSDVANNPDEPAARSALLEKSSTVADTLKNAHGSLGNQWSTTRAQLGAYAAEVNTTASAVAQLNDTIVAANATGLPVNELEDQRDLHMMHLAELTGATASKRDNGAMDVFLGGSSLVSGTIARKMEVSGAARLEDQATDSVKLRWTDTQTAVTTAGTMGSMSDTMTSIIPGLSAKLDAVAANLASSVNAQHALGYGLDGINGRPFFTGTTADTITVAITDPAQVAVSATAGTFDGSNADLLADIGTSATGPDKDYQRMIADLGVASQTAGRRADIQSNVTLQVDAARESEAGVNLDEEMTNLLTYQRSYEAASRVMTTIDSMIDQLINRTGLVGR